MDNRPGGGTVVAMELVVKAPPDGYTLLGASDTLMLNGVLSGQIQMTFSNTVTSGVHLRSGKLRGLAITGSRRGQVFPDMPTVSEAGVPGFELTNSYAYFAPAGTPRAIVRAINAIVSQGMNSPDTLKALAAEGSEVAAPATPEEFKAKFDRDYAGLEKLIKAANIQLK